MTDQRDIFDPIVTDSAEVPRAVLNAIRVFLGIVGAGAALIGIFMLAWPDKSLMVLAFFVALYWVIAGVTRLALGIFPRDMGGSFRALNIVFGALFLIGGVIAFRNLEAATAVLTTIVVILVGIGWIIDGVMGLVQAGRNRAAWPAYAASVLGIVAGVIVIAVPGWTALALTVTIGIVFLLLGTLAIVQAFRLTSLPVPQR